MREDAEQLGMKFATEQKTGGIAQLRAISAADLLEAAKRFYPGGNICIPL